MTAHKKDLPAGFTLRHARGFTLIELLVVISILAILAVVGFTIFSGSTAKTNDAKKKADVVAIAKALELHYNGAAGKYSDLVEDSWFTSGQKPKRPETGNPDYAISWNPDKSGFQICALLGGNGSCSSPSPSCFCKLSQRGTFIAAAGTPTPAPSGGATPTPSPTSAPTPTPTPVANAGMNVTGITHYGKGDLFPWAPDSNITADLAEIQNMEGRVIRVFVANNQISDSEAAARLDAFLTRAAGYNISVVATLIDFYNSGFGPQGVAYNRCDFSPCLLGTDFFSTSGANSFRLKYKSFVQTVVNTIVSKGHSNLYAWEIGNELKYEFDSNLFVNFMNEMSGFIKSLDSSRPISTGMMYAAHQGMTASDLYSRLTNFDIISIHSYDANRTGAADASWARSNGKRILVGEVGFNGVGDRSGSMSTELNYWKGQGAEVILQWGFIANGLSDNGNGDTSSGMDTIWHTDYNNLSNTFKLFN